MVRRQGPKIDANKKKVEWKWGIQKYFRAFAVDVDSIMEICLKMIKTSVAKR